MPEAHDSGRAPRAGDTGDAGAVTGAAPVPGEVVAVLELGELSPQEVVSRSAAGAAKTTLIGLLGRAAGLMVTLLVTHLVSKAEYGNANLAMIVAAVLNMVTLLSPQQALLTLHDQAGFAAAARVVHGLACWSGVVVAALLALAAPWIVAALGQPEATLLLRVYCVALVLERMTLVPALALRFHLRFGDVARVDLIGDLAYVAVTLGAGLLGVGGLCLALGMVARHGAKRVVLGLVGQARWACLAFWPRGPLWGRAERRLFADVMRRSWPIHLGGCGEFLTLYLDNLCVGKFYQAAAEGLYAVGYTLVMTPADTIALYVGSALVRAFGLRDGAVRRRAYLTGLRYVAILLFPIGAGAVLCAEPLSLALLPARWQGVAPIMVALSGAAMTMGLMRLAFVHLTGIGRMRAAGLMDGVRLVLFVAALAVVLALDPERRHLPWIGWAVTAAYGVSAGVGLLISLRADGIAIGAAARALWPAAGATLAMSGLVLVVKAGLGRLGAGAGVMLAGMIGAGAVGYVTYLRLVHRALYAEASGWVRERLRER